MTWTLRALLGDAGVSATIQGDAPVSGMCLDSRTVRAGDLFCCVPGSRVDGHDLAGDAVAAGASALLVQRLLPVDAAQAKVADVRSAMGPVAAALFGHPARSVPVAGVTGTNGKTTTTYLVEAMLVAAGRTPGVLGTVDYRVGGHALDVAHTLGTPEAPDLQRILAAMRDRGADAVAMEVTSIALDKRRVDGMRFACAAFTNLTQDHIDDYHGTMEAYFEAKAMLFDSQRTRTAVVNLDDPYGRRVAERCRDVELTGYSSRGREAALTATEPELNASGMAATLRWRGASMRISTTLVGRFNLDNILCAAGMALCLGLSLDDIARGVRTVRVPGRLEPVDAGQPYTVLVDYAHTPDALGHALGACRGLTSRRVIVVFGCGGDRDRGKRPLMGEVATSKADVTIVTSDNPRSEDPARIIDDILDGARRGAGTCVVEPDRRNAIASALDRAEPGDVVLVAGKGHETGQTFADRTLPFDDRQVVRELLEAACRA